MMMNRTWASIAVAVAAVLFGRCSLQGPTAAGGTDYPNTRTIAGILHDSAGHPLAAARAVLLEPATPVRPWYEAVDTAITDTAGSFRFDAVAPGVYAIEAISAAGDQAAIADSIDTENADSLGVIALSAAGSLRAVVEAGSTVDARLGLRNTALSRAPDATGMCVFEAIPNGEYDLYVRARDTTHDLPAFDSTITRIAIDGDTVLVEPIILPPLYRAHLTPITLNTTRSGAHSVVDLAGFPALVRLDADVFDFSSADAQGADIGFADRHGKSFRFEIEAWDQAKKAAAVWVRLDTLHADTVETIYLLSGRNALADAAGALPVFDPADGFAAVYHLSEDAAGVGDPALYRDASGNGAHGIDSVSSDRKEGVIGPGQGFDGVDDYIPIPQTVAIDGDITVSAWIKIDAVTDEFDEGIQIYSTYRHNDQHPYGFELRTHMNDLVFIGGDGGPRNQAASWNVVTVLWTHVAAVYSAADGTVQLFVDGAPAEMNEDTVSTPIRYDGAVSYISAPVNFTMDGIIDEVRVERTGRSDAWIRMCYENQNARQSLVEFIR